jgi:Xaa-Pro dipeptidase
MRSDMSTPTFSRRGFLGASTLAVAATACGVTGGQTERPDRSDDDLPKPIAALSSLADQATPITTDERRARLDRARELMQQTRIDAVLLPGGTSLRYFTGLQWGISERLLALVLPAKGKAFLVAPRFEEARAMEQLEDGPIGSGADILVWNEHESPYELVAKGLRDRGISTGTLGAEETLRFMFADGIAQAAPALKVVSATPVTAGCRMVKDHHEIALMRLACAATLRAYRAVYESLTEGMTQATVRDLISTAHRRLGFTGGASVQVGEYSALPHGSRTPQTIREGTIIMVDGGCNAEGYQSDITRTFVLGKPSDKMKQIFDIVHRAQTAALAAARPGGECQSVDAAARKVIVDAGYGPDYTYFSHRLGHGIGMDGHEWPYLVKGNTLAMERGMTFSDEPGIYIPGEFGVRLEDDMHITPSGAELLTPQSPSIEEPFGGMNS